MSDQFKVPEPSEAARRAYLTALNVEPGTLGSVLAAAYAQDVPAIVRAEVERALRKRQEDPLNFGIAAYLAARFGEPENAKTVCGMGDDNCRDGVTACTRGKGHPGNHYSVHADRSWPSPSAPAAPSVTAAPPERREPEGLKLGPSAVEIPVTFRKTDSGEVVGYAITPAERDFLRALAAGRVVAADFPCAAAIPVVDPVLTAARRVAEEAK